MLRWMAVLAVTLVASVASAQPIKVAIVPSAPTLDEIKVDQITQDMAEGLTSVLEVEVLGGLEVRRQLPPEGAPVTCANELPCQKDVAARLGVQQVLFVVIIDIGGSLQVDSTWAEPATGKTARRRAIDVPTIDATKQKFADSARVLLPDAPVKKVAQPGGGGGIGGRMSEEIPPHFTPAAYATAGLAVVGVGVGVGFGLAARSRYKDCDAPGASCSKGRRDSIRNFGLLADAGFLIGIGGAVATGILYATSGKESRLVIDPAPGGATVGARLTW